MRENRYDVVVVGAGLAGLITATVTARAGAKTLVLDAHPPGGRARTTDRDGFLFNEGPHAMYETGALLRVLRGFGVDPKGARPPTPAFLERGGRRYPLPAGPLELARTHLLSLRGRVAAARLLARLAKLDASTLTGRSVTDWFDDEELPADVRDLLLPLIRVTTFTNAPDLFDAGVAASQLQMAITTGVRYVDGGWGTVVRALVGEVEAAGGTVQSGWGVGAVRSDGWDASVEVGGSELSARAVVLAGLPPHEAARVVGEEWPWLSGLGAPVEVTCLGLALERVPDPPVVFGVDRPLYLSVHAPTAALAPPGRAIVEVMRYRAPGDDDPADDVRAELADFARRSGIPDAGIVDQRFLRRMTVVHAMPMARTGGLAGRPAVTATGLGNVFLAGDWIGSEGFLSDASAASAMAAAEAALRVAQPVGVA
jgi:phytoene dehydrogenase-like protein